MQPSNPSRPPQRPPVRANLTDRLLDTWERLRPRQRDTAWQMVATLRAAHASERRRHRILSLAIVGTLSADAVLAYLLLHAPH